LPLSLSFIPSFIVTKFTGGVLCCGLFCGFNWNKHASHFVHLSRSQLSHSTRTQQPPVNFVTINEGMKERESGNEENEMKGSARLSFLSCFITQTKN
jgi:hypothetical protein